MAEDVALEANEHREHAEHTAHSGDGFLRRVSITIAVLAVVSAAISSLEANESASAIASASEAVLRQDRATDQWAFYQAKSIKADMFAIAATQQIKLADQYNAKSEQERNEQRDIRTKAEEEEAAARTSEAEQAAHEGRHHILGLSETVSHVGIAIATIAIVTRQRWPWFSAIALGALAVAIACKAYV